MSFRKRAIGIVCTGCVAASGFVLSKRSMDTLDPTSLEVQTITICAASKPMFGPKGEKITFEAYHGFRTEIEHRAMIERGVTWVNRSRHQDGMAIDVMAEVNGVGTWDHWPYYIIAKSFYQCGKEKGIPITWGGEWRFKDMVHFEVKK